VHMSGELFKAMTGINMQHVPYRGSAPAMQDLLSNRVQVMFDDPREAAAVSPNILRNFPTEATRVAAYGNVGGNIRQISRCQRLRACRALA